jgi:hypothetical protein
MFNFNGPITRTEIERFHALSGFLGACIDNVFELIKTLQTIMGVQFVIDSKEKITLEVYEVFYQKLSGFRQFDIPLTLIRET